MGKRVYTDEERAAVFVALKVNEGNAARSSRDTGVPENTVRDWKARWASRQWDVPNLDHQEKATSEAITATERVRDKALLLLEDKLGEVKPDKLATVYGILDDKVRLHRGLPTSRSESQLALPAAEEVRDRLIEGVRLALTAQREREQDIIEVDVEEQAQVALPAHIE